MAWIAPRTWAVNEVLTAANMNTYISDDLSWMGTSRPHCRANDSSFSHTSSGNWQNPSWNSVSPNVGPSAPAAAGTGYIAVPAAGFYLIGAGATFDSNATGARGLMLSSAANGAGTIHAQHFVPSQPVAVGGTICTMLQCTASQIIYLSLYQGSGGTLTITNAHMWAIWETT